MPDERDDLIDRALRRSALEPASEDACLDAETAAAWADGTLDESGLRQARRHVADCARCQSLMTTLMAMEEPERIEQPIQPGQRATAFSRFRWSWAVPLATAATVLIAAAVWLRTPSPSQSGQPGRSGEPAVAAPSSAAPQLQFSQPDQTQPGTPTDRPEPQPRRSEPARPLAKTAPGDLARDSATVSSPSEPAERADAKAEQSRRAPAAPPAAPTGNGVSADPRATLNEIVATRTGGVTVQSPEAAVRWRITQGAVQKSADGGETWQPVPSPVSTAMVAGAAPSPNTCWLVGAAGQVFLTVDGSTWSRVSFPEPVDLTGVTATDARTATVTTADGRQFETGDRGASWTTK